MIDIFTDVTAKTTYQKPTQLTLFFSVSLNGFKLCFYFSTTRLVMCYQSNLCGFCNFFFEIFSTGQSGSFGLVENEKPNGLNSIVYRKPKLRVLFV